MTVHPIDTEALRQDVDFAQRLTGTYQADSTRGYYPAMERVFEAVPALLDALAAAERRADGAEAREEQLLLRNRHLIDAHRQAEARIKAVEDVLDSDAAGPGEEPLIHVSHIRRALDGDA